MGIMIPQRFAIHCKSIKATVDFSTFSPTQKKNIYKMVKTGRFSSSWPESPTTVIAKSIYHATKQPYFQIQRDMIRMHNIPSTHPIVEALKGYYALVKLMPENKTGWDHEKPSQLYDLLEEAQRTGRPLEDKNYWNGFRLDLHRDYRKSNPPEFKAILGKIKDISVLEMPDDAPAVIKAKQIIEGKVTEMIFNYIT